MRNIILFINKNQKGFTLTELLVALAITAVMSSAIAMSVSQLFSVSIGDTNRMNAVKQVENALHYINRDAQQSSIDRSQIPIITNTSLTSVPLVLKWTNYVDNKDYEVSYSVTGNDLIRTQTVNNRPPTTAVITNTRVASDISSDSTYSFNGEVILINLVSSVEGYRPADEFRAFEVKPRVN